MKVHRSRTEPNRFARSLFASLPTRYDRLAAVLSLGQDRRWRRAMVDRVIGGPARVLDVATGPAGVALQLAERTGAHVLGVDLSEPMLRRGQANVRTAGRQEQITLVLARAEELPFADSGFGALTFTYLLRYVSDPAATLAELARVVRPGGTIASLEFAVPPSRLWRAAWWMYTRLVLPSRRVARRPRLVRRRPVLGTEHLGARSHLPARVDGRGVGGRASSRWGFGA